MKTAMTRSLLKSLMIAGVLLMPIGPCIRASNEGFGDPPGPIQLSQRWQRISYVLIPLGALVVIAAGIGLVIVDRHSNDSELKQPFEANED
jgi:hypothetical protein